ncbi:MAG: hypothetical protein JWP63_1438 [Candidatus Solibacter sp.]|nr:hypothetical protein [Candidatus Solibacter sp.]
MQFQHAEPLEPEVLQDDGSPRCVVCKRPTGSSHFQAQGMVVCAGCAEQIRTGQQASPVISLAHSALYGAGAALAGCLLYAAVSIFLHVEIALIAILVGYMVGRAIRYGSEGKGGRPQQILAVLLTYFAITMSYIVVVVYHSGLVLSGSAVVYLLMLGAVAPFLTLGSSGISGLIGLFIIFIGLQRAWRMTGRAEIAITGPYSS